jgi:hypothetical protein
LRAVGEWARVASRVTRSELGSNPYDIENRCIDKKYYVSKLALDGAWE